MVDATIYRHQCVRDLVWAVQSPPLMKSLSGDCWWPQPQWFLSMVEGMQQWLQQLDNNPAELESLLQTQKDRRLGRYFETLWLYWFRHHPGFDVISHNQQIIIDGNTLGELDFIVHDRVRNKVLHIEVAIKFYLGVGETTSLSSWHGPNLMDRLDIKLEHLLSRQTRLTGNTEVNSWLKEQGIVVDECAVILKGRLYIPADTYCDKTANTACLPAGCNPDLLYGRWYRKSLFTDVFNDARQFVPLINQGWLERIPTPSVKNFYSKSDIFETLSKNNLRLPLHLQLFNPRYDGDKAFLTADNWPEKNI